MMQRIKKVKTQMQMKLRDKEIKGHFRRHKELYIGIAIGAALTAGVAAMFFFRQRAIANTVKVVETNLVKWNSPTTVNSVLLNFAETSTPSKPVHLVGTNIYAGSIHEMARLRNHSASMVSRCANGHIADVKGDVFEFVTPSA
jgi:hypothetical protein